MPQQSEIIKRLTQKLLPGHAPGTWILRYQGELPLSLLSTIWEQGPDLTSSQHPDLQLISPEKDKDYKVDDLEPICSFSSFKPWQWKQKFLIFTAGERLGHNVANKLLKILEEPPAFMSVGILVPKNTQLLATLEGRAVSFYLPEAHLPWNPPSDTEWPGLFSNFLQRWPQARSALETLWKWAGNKITTAQAIDDLEGENGHYALSLLRELAIYFAHRPDLLQGQLDLDHLWQISTDYNNGVSERSFLILAQWKNWIRYFPKGPGATT